jgi:bifunctional non-homologous end joining protein LigD
MVDRRSSGKRALREPPRENICWRQGITPAVMKHCHWSEPALLAQINFTEWIGDDQLRQPVFLGLRADKKAKDIARE